MPASRALDTHDLRRGLRGQANPSVLSFQLHRLLRVLKLYCKVTSSELPAPQLLRVLQLYYKVASAHLPAPQILHASRPPFAHSTRTISAEGCAGSRKIPLACISRTRHARSPQRVARAAAKSHSRLHFAHTTRTLSAEGRAGTRHIALSPVFRALDTHDLRRGLRADRTNRTLACISRTRHTRSPQRVARGPDKSHSRLHFARSTRTISAEGCARSRQIALSPAFRALDTRDLRRGLRADRTNRTLACISGTRHARSPQRVARAAGKSHSRLHFARSTRTISAEGCARSRQIALSPAFRALDAHDLRRGLHFRLTLFVPPSAFKREFIKWGNVFSLGHLPCIFHTHTCLLIACSHTRCILAYSSLAYLHLHSFTLALHTLHFTAFALPLTAFGVVKVSMCKCKCRSVSVQRIFRKNPSQCFREKRRRQGPVDGQPAPSDPDRYMEGSDSLWLQG